MGKSEPTISFRETRDRPIWHLRGAHLERASFHRARLQAAHLEDAHLQGARLEGANLDDTYFFGAEFDGPALNSVRRAFNWRNAHFDPNIDQPLHSMACN